MTSMLTILVFNSQSVLRLILLNVSIVFETLGHSLPFDMLSSVSLRGTTLTGCSCSGSSAAPSSFPQFWMFWGLQNPSEEVLRLSLIYECLVPIWSHSVPLICMMKMPNFKSSVQISSYILILHIQLPNQNLYWMLNRHLEINTSIIRVLILSHQPASLSDFPIPKTSNSIFQVTQAKNLESSLILCPST